MNQVQNVLASALKSFTKLLTEHTLLISWGFLVLFFLIFNILSRYTSTSGPLLALAWPGHYRLPAETEH